MPRPFFFLIEVRPTSVTPRASDVGGANAHIWVISETVEEAELRARGHLIDYAWNVTAVVHALAISNEQIARLGKEEAALYRQALAHGLASEFVAWPLEDRTGGMIESRSLGGPIIDDGKPQ